MRHKQKAKGMEDLKLQYTAIKRLQITRALIADSFIKSGRVGVATP
jgi:hypothetical protein